MPIPRARLGRTPLAILLAGLLAACSSTTDPSGSALEAAGSGPIAASSLPRPTVTATPSPTPEPTASYTNPPDPDLLALIPDAVGSVSIVKPPIEDYGLTPGDIGEVFGDIGLHFRSLAIAYIQQPRLSFYAMRMDGPMATTADLEPHLAEIGRYVGIAGLDPAPWSLAVVADREVWMRPEDNATAAGTMIYTWIADDVAFLLIGTDDAVNQALIAELPGVPASTPTQVPSADPIGSAPASPAG